MFYYTFTWESAKEKNWKSAEIWQILVCLYGVSFFMEHGLNMVNYT